MWCWPIRHVRINQTHDWTIHHMKKNCTTEGTFTEQESTHHCEASSASACYSKLKSQTWFRYSPAPLLTRDLTERSPVTHSGFLNSLTRSHKEPSERLARSSSSPRTGQRYNTVGRTVHRRSALGQKMESVEIMYGDQYVYIVMTDARIN